MNTASIELREKLQQLCKKWRREGLPSRQEIQRIADELLQWKQTHRVNGIWPKRPAMLTATLDDGIGQGIRIIEWYARVLGFKVNPIGLLQTPRTLIHQCRKLQPDVLGLTILQLDSDDALAEVGHNLPPKTRLIAGGPVFKFDPDMALRCRVDYVAPNVAHFVDYLLNQPAFTRVTAFGFFNEGSTDFH